MYGVLGEDTSDVKMLQVFIRRLAGDRSIKMRCKGFSGCANLLKDGTNVLRAMLDLGCSRFVVCYDADGPDPADHKEKVMSRIVRPAGVTDNCCVLVPVQEIEAWILADIESITRIFSSWRPVAISNPEAIERPKEHLKTLSRAFGIRYDHVVYNERVAAHLNLQTVCGKCPSFRPLLEFVRR